MLVTVYEAKRSWCCVTTDECRCIGDTCMAWRWFDGEFATWKRGVLVPEEEHIERIERERSDYEKRRRGYCGLAGKPEFE